MTGQQLKNSILQMAVQGKLVPQDPNDEPASVLLERIRAEKEQLIKEGKIKKERNPSIIFRGADNLPYEKFGKNEPVCIADEVPFEIPESWEWVRLGTILHKLSDGTHSRPHYVASGIPFISVKDISGGKLDFSDCKYITEEEHCELYSRCNPEYGDILLTKVGTTGIPVIVDTTNEFSLFVSVALLKFNQEMLSNEYLACLINSPLVQKQAEKNTRGVGNKNWVMRDIANTLIVIPPLLEQQRIVSKLQKILPFVDNYAHAYSKAKKLNNGFPNLLKKSILQEAVQGKLVPQDPNDEPASILLERIRAEKERLIKAGKIKRDKHESVIFRRDNSHYEKLNGIERCIDDEIPFEIPENWSWTRLRTLTSKIGAGSTPTGGRAIYQPTGVKFIRSQNVYNDGLVLNDVAYISEEINQRKSGSIVKPKDILLNITGGSIGRSALVPDDFDIGNVNQHVMIIRLLTPSIRYWVHAVLISEYIQNMIMSVQVGVSREGLSASKLMDFLIPLPSERESYRIINEYNKACNVLHQI